ncbi:MAG: glycosyltransferase family 2 protein [Candidatus Shapirobacteria bacterium]|nr:glycosyltransferase family 2 protein [Candidatus Shapirobacteria bacterium]
MTDISIIIPNWNGEKQLAKNLPILVDVLSQSKIRTEIIVIDDASSDNSLIIIEKFKKENLFKNFTILKKNINKGFADSVNRGVAAAKSKVVFLLNTDVVIKKGCLEALLSHFKKNNVFAVGANADWQLGIIRFEDGFLDISSPKKVSPKMIVAQKSFWVSGGHAAFRKDLWQRLGGIDTLFAPFYFEETDLCYRAWKRGYQVLWEPKAKVEHHHEESVIRHNFPANYINFIAQRNQLFFIWKNVHNPQMLREHYFNVMKRIISNPKYIIILLSALKGLSQILIKRRIEQKEAILSDREVLELVANN